MIEVSSNRKSAYARKRGAAVRECEAAGLAPNSYDPWPDRVLRRLGLRRRPPHYRGLLSVVVTMVCVAVTITAVNALITRDVELVRSAVGGGVMALLIGAKQFWEVQRERRKHGLSEWKDL
jgi:hypothetical protein